MPDLRQQRRFPTHFLATWESAGSCKSGDGIVENIGMGGCKIRTPAPTDVGVELVLTLFLPRHGLLGVQGIVRWQVGYDMGLEFIRLEPAQLQQLHRFLAALSLRRAEPIPAVRERSETSPPA